jgi:hypothetical protein
LEFVAGNGGVDWEGAGVLVGCEGWGAVGRVTKEDDDDDKDVGTMVEEDEVVRVG